VCREKCKNEFKKDEQVTKNCVEKNAKMNLKKMSEWQKIVSKNAKVNLKTSMVFSLLTDHIWNVTLN